MAETGYTWIGYISRRTVYVVNTNNSFYLSYWNANKLDIVKLCIICIF